MKRWIVYRHNGLVYWSHASAIPGDGDPTLDRVPGHGPLWEAPSITRGGPTHLVPESRIMYSGRSQIRARERAVKAMGKVN